MKNDPYFRWMYVAEKFSGAVETLCTSFAPNWQRMHDAVIQISVLLPDHFPDQDLYERYSGVISDAKKFGPLEITKTYWVGSFENTLKRRKRSTFERMADEILDIYREVQKRRGTYEEE